MRGIGTDEPLLAFRRAGAQIPAHVTRWQAQGAKAGNSHVGKILANTPAVLEELLKRRGNGCRLIVIMKAGMDSMVELQHPDQQRLPLGKTRLSELSQLWRRA